MLLKMLMEECAMEAMRLVLNLITEKVEMKMEMMA